MSTTTSTRAARITRSDPDLRSLVLPPLSDIEVALLTDPLASFEKARLVDVIDIDGILNDPDLAGSPRIYRACIGSLRAIGYSYDWLAKVMGVSEDEVAWTVRDRLIPEDLMKLALTVAARIGDRPATPESTGMTEEEIEAVIKQARRDNRFVPAAYDEQYRYVVGATLSPARRAGSDDETHARNRLRALAYFVRNGGSARAISQVYDFDQRSFARWRAELGLAVINHGNGGVEAKEGQEPLKAAILRAAELAEDGDVAPAPLWENLKNEASMIQERAMRQMALAEQDAAA